MKNHVDGVVLVAGRAEKGNSRTAGLNETGRQGCWPVGEYWGGVQRWRANKGVLGAYQTFFLCT